MTSGVLYGAVASAAVVVVLNGLLCGAAVMQQWFNGTTMCVRSNSWINTEQLLPMRRVPPRRTVHGSVSVCCPVARHSQITCYAE